MFNRNKDINSIILMNLDDEDLWRICGDPAYKNVCGNDMFWRQRTINRFGSSFEALSEERNESIESILEKYSKLYAKNWREYYTSLVSFMEHIYANEESTLEYYSKGREDLIYLTAVATINKEEIKESIEEQTDDWKERIKEVIVNPNIFNLFFDAITYDSLFGNIEKYLKYILQSFKYLLSLDDKRIKPYLLLPILLKIFPNQDEEISEIRSLILNDPRITLEDIQDALSDIRHYKSVNSNVMNDYLNFVGTKLSSQENTLFLRKIIAFLHDY